ncbi:MAG: hypothetical protein U0R50_09660 [Gaiellales bacterium]
MTIAFAAALAVIGVGETSADAGRDACGPKTEGGVTVRTWCGPAKASVTWNGRTMTIKGGSCELVDYEGVKAFTVNTGRYTVPPAKPRATAFSAAGSDTKPGTYGGWLINWQTPGKQWIVAARGLEVKILAKGARRGSFTGRIDTGGKVRGSWTC